MKKAKKSHRRLVKTIRRTNAKFEKATPSERRVMIAKDVIASLISKKLRPQTGVYIQSATLINSIEKSEKNQQVQDLLLKLPTCTVCARGAIFVCAVKRFNNLTCGQANKKMNDYEFVDPAENALVKGFDCRYFSVKQLALIEQAFECRDNSSHLPDSEWLSNEEKRTAYEFGRNFTIKNRMIAIMGNIIENKGKFIP